MRKLLERLRSQKAQAVTRMEELNNSALLAKRDLNATEREEYNRLSAEVAELKADIENLEAAVVAPPAPKPTPVVENESERLSRIEAENVRLKNAEKVRNMVALARKNTPALSETLAAEMIEQNLSIEQVAERLFAEQAKINAQQPTQVSSQSGRVELNRDERDSMREGMTSALLVRYDPKTYSGLQDKARDYAGLSLSEMAREYLRLAGVPVKGKSKDQIACLALHGAAAGAEWLAGLHSTSDFPNILLDAANKTLRQGYSTAPQTFKAFMRQASASDFKNVNRVALSDAPVLLPVGQHGEYKRVSISDSKETYALATYGWIVGITRKVLVNDDLDALTRIPFLCGQAAARLESNVAWGIITDNAAMADSVALFHADHDNLNASSALANDILGAARAAMRKQTGPKGDYLDIVPSYLIGPVALEQTILQLLNPIQLAATAVTGIIPQWIRNLTPITEPRLDVNSTTTWYLAADPASIDTIEYCYLEGENGVYTEQRVGFDVDGIEMKARLDFAAKAIDYRGLSKNTA